MLRAWLAALRVLDTKDTQASPDSENEIPSDEEKEKAQDANENEKVKDDEATSETLPSTEETPSVEETSQDPTVTNVTPTPSSPSSPDRAISLEAEWDDDCDQKAYREATDVNNLVSETPLMEQVSVDIVVDRVDFLDLKFKMDTAPMDDPPLSFRDVLIRSRCLEELVSSFTLTPADSETSNLFQQLVFQLVLPAGDEDVETLDECFITKTEGEISEGNASSPSVTDPRCNSSSRRVAEAIAKSVTDTAAALRDKHRTTPNGIQLGNDSLVNMLCQCAGSVKRSGIAETLKKRQEGLEQLLRENQTKVDTLGTTRGRDGHAESGNKTDVGDDETSTTTTDPSDTTTQRVDCRVTSTSALAAATLEGVALARKAHDHAAAISLRLAHESELKLTEDLIMRCRFASETLTKATSELRVLSDESKVRLLEAEKFRDEKVDALVSVETDTRKKADELEEKRLSLEKALEVLTQETNSAKAEADHAMHERQTLEQSSEMVRETLERKVKDLANRQNEYSAELNAIEVVRETLRCVARLRAGAVERATHESNDSLANARVRYAAAAKEHCEGQLSAARLCLARLRFCAKELLETENKRKEASKLGLLTVRHAARDVTGNDSSVSQDLSQKSNAMERAYFEAEESARCVFAASLNSKKEAMAICPAACESVSGAKDISAQLISASRGDVPGFLSTVLGAIDEARGEFESLERPTLELEKVKESVIETDRGSGTAGDADLTSSESEVTIPEVEGVDVVKTWSEALLVHESTDTADEVNAFMLPTTSMEPLTPEPEEPSVPDEPIEPSPVEDPEAEPETPVWEPTEPTPLVTPELPDKKPNDPLGASTLEPPPPTYSETTGIEVEVDSNDQSVDEDDPDAWLSDV